MGRSKQEARSQRTEPELRKETVAPLEAEERKYQLTMEVEVETIGASKRGSGGEPAVDKEA